MVKGLYFSTGDAAAAADKAIVLNADNLVSIGTATATTSKMYFLDRANTGAETVLTLTHAEAQVRVQVCARRMQKMRMRCTRARARARTPTRTRVCPRDTHKVW